MIIYEWKENDYPICPQCKISSALFSKLYNRSMPLSKVENKLPKDKMLVFGSCLWKTCRFIAIIPKTWRYKLKMET